jgi:hypothetical protein
MPSAWFSPFTALMKAQSLRPSQRSSRADTLVDPVLKGK